MELKDFISGTLIQIIEGVSEAQNYAAENNTKVNPPNLTLIKAGSNDIYCDTSNSKYAQIVDFDVAITTSDESSGKAGIGIFVGPVGIGGQTKSDQSNSSVSKLKFSVPVLLPTQKNQE